MRIDRGFDWRGLVTVDVALDGTTHQTDERRLGYFQEALAQIRQLPEVRSASATEFLPIYATSFVGARYRMGGRPALESSMVVPVFSEYIRTMGGHILWGRELPMRK